MKSFALKIYPISVCLNLKSKFPAYATKCQHSKFPFQMLIFGYSAKKAKVNVNLVACIKLLHSTGCGALVGTATKIPMSFLDYSNKFETFT